MSLESRRSLGLPVSDPRSLCRVVHVERGAVFVDGDHSGVVHVRDVDVTVGDVVTVDPFDVVPRRTVLSRDDGGRAHALAANVDEVWCVVAADQGLNQRRLERALLLAYDGGAVPVVVVSKADLGDVDADDINVVAPGVDVVVSSARDGSGVDVLRARLAVPVDVGGEGVARTAVVLGVSGAGKSALVNAVVGADVAAEGDVQADARGRHTTTSRHLVVVPSGGLLLDTPGLRAFGVAVDDDALAQAFPEIEALAPDCRFRDCSHEHEPGCAVRGVVDEARLQSFFALRREAAWARDRHDAVAQRALKQKHKALTNAAWQHVRDKRGGR